MCVRGSVSENVYRRRTREERRGGEGMGAGGYPLPPGLGPYGLIPPAGNPLAVLDPLGQAAGMRTRSIKDAETLRDVQNILLPRFEDYLHVHI